MTKRMMSKASEPKARRLHEMMGCETGWLAQLTCQFVATNHRGRFELSQRVSLSRSSYEAPLVSCRVSDLMYSDLRYCLEIRVLMA